MKYNENIQKKVFISYYQHLIIYGIFLIYPMLSAFHYSFFKWNMISESKYVGMKHYIRMFGDRRFLEFVFNNNSFYINKYFYNYYFIFFISIIISGKNNAQKCFSILHICPCCFDYGSNSSRLAIYVPVNGGFF